MMQNVKTVLVGKTMADTAGGTGGAAIYTGGSATIAGFSAGEFFLEDETGKLVGNASGDSANAKALRIGMKTGNTYSYTDVAGATQTKDVIKYTPYIKKGSVKSAVYNVYGAPAEDTIMFDFGTVDNIIVGNRYVVRFIYRDLYEHPGQFTKTYEVIATSTTLNSLIQAFKKAINKDVTKRVEVKAVDTTDNGTNFTASTDLTSGAEKLLVRALAKSDNEGKESINIYTQVSMTAVAYFTNPNATGFASKIKQPITNLVITKPVTATPGKGFWKQVRDAEQAALAYKGITYRTSWPYSLLKPELNVVKDETYDSLVIQFENTYLTPDNQLNSTTRHSIEIYTAGDFTNSVLKNRFDAFTA